MIGDADASRTPADIELDLDDLDVLIGAITTAFRSPADADRLLRRIGFPADRVPSFAMDHRYAWKQVFDDLASGIVPTPYRRVIEAAAKTFPANPTFRRLREKIAQLANGIRHVVVVAASPTDAERVRGDRELRAIIDAGRSSRLTITPMPAAAATDLRELRRLRPDVLHLAGHGNENEFVFESPTGDSAPISANRVVGLLASYRRHDDVRLAAIVLNSCYSAGIARLFAPVADVVVGHRGELDDECAVAFASELYRALRDARSFAAAASVAAATAAVSSPYCTNLEDDLIVLGGEH